MRNNEIKEDEIKSTRKTERYGDGLPGGSVNPREEASTVSLARTRPTNIDYEYRMKYGSDETAIRRGRRIAVSFSPVFVFPDPGRISWHDARARAPIPPFPAGRLYTL